MQFVDVVNFLEANSLSHVFYIVVYLPYRLTVFTDPNAGKYQQ